MFKRGPVIPDDPAQKSRSRGELILMTNSRRSRMTKCARLLLPLPLLFCGWPPANAQDIAPRKLSGVIVTRNNERVAGVKVSVRSSPGEQSTDSDAEGNFQLSVPGEALTLKLEGKNIVPREKLIAPGGATENLSIEVEFVIPSVHESLVITAQTL